MSTSYQFKKMHDHESGCPLLDESSGKGRQCLIWTIPIIICFILAFFSAVATYSFISQVSFHSGSSECQERRISTQCFTRLVYRTLESRITAEKASKEFEDASTFVKIDSFVDTTGKGLKYVIYDFLLRTHWKIRQERYDFEPIFGYIALFLIGLFAECCFKSRLDYKRFTCGRLILTFLTLYAAMIVVFGICVFVSVFIVSCPFGI